MDILGLEAIKIKGLNMSRYKIKVDGIEVRVFSTKKPLNKFQIDIKIDNYANEHFISKAGITIVETKN